MTSLLTMRHMRLEDIPQVLSIDKISFPNFWSPRTYQFEITNRDTSFMMVLETPARDQAMPPDQHDLLYDRAKHPALTTVCGYAGCWLIAGEAHISTLAVHPDFRGKGLGELMLTAMLQRALYLGGEYSVLEVRASNAVAQALYKKYEYKIVGRRKGYYRDNLEDALLMEVRPLNSAYQKRLLQRSKIVYQRNQFIDQFTRQAKPLPV